MSLDTARFWSGLFIAWLVQEGLLQVLQGILSKGMPWNHESAVEVWKEEET